MNRFHYTLAPLLRYSEMMLQPLQVALSDAVAKVVQAEQLLASQQGELTDCERAMSILAGNTTAYLSALAFVREMHGQVASQREALAFAVFERDSLSASLAEARMKVRQLEKHRERHRQVHLLEQTRRDYRLQDDLALAGNVAGRRSYDDISGQ